MISKGQEIVKDAMGHKRDNDPNKFQNRKGFQ